MLNGRLGRYGKLGYCGIDPELEHKLDLMFMGVVATRDHAWTPNQGLDHEHDKSKDINWIKHNLCLEEHLKFSYGKGSVIVKVLDLERENQLPAEVSWAALN
ncbi:hypothetical protein IEQ34_013600 [Dendrobium chrysotoxum]|uniref:Uncharacterized protein n=1 Tax=Dendrobium chrysotoxum TaxID=161865 RepID=A0AAV7GSR7_DENCH|nr:hypothetical protein IEQ34_013600 [Dendrobium chrysotoxum]